VAVGEKGEELPLDDLKELVKERERVHLMLS
jgi:hypothetical protein